MSSLTPIKTFMRFIATHPASGLTPKKAELEKDAVAHLEKVARQLDSSLSKLWQPTKRQQATQIPQAKQTPRIK
jgi:hypothetical protein